MVFSKAREFVFRLVLIAAFFQITLTAQAVVPKDILKVQVTPKKTLLTATREVLALPLANRLDALEQQGEQGYRNLIAIMFDDTGPMAIRWRAVTLVGRIGRRQSFPELERALTHQDWFMRNAGLVAMAHIDRNRAISWARKLISDKALVVRAAAVQTLGDLRDTDSTPLLWEKLYAKENFHNNQSLFVRRRIMEALTILKRAGDEGKFVSVLTDRDQLLHPLAIMALEKLTGSTLGISKDPIALKRERWQSWWRDQPQASM
jgi:hypothetical protein